MCLLLQRVIPRRFGSFFLECEVHLLKSAILLRTTWLDALEAIQSRNHQTKAVVFTKRAQLLPKGAPFFSDRFRELELPPAD